jgi:hypothetical protein
MVALPLLSLMPWLSGAGGSSCLQICCARALEFNAMISNDRYKRRPVPLFALLRALPRIVTSFEFVQSSSR